MAAQKKVVYFLLMLINIMSVIMDASLLVKVAG